MGRSPSVFHPDAAKVPQVFLPYTEVLGLYDRGLKVPGDAIICWDLSVYTKGKRFVDLFNQGKGRIDWKATASDPWVALSRAEGRFETQQRVWVQIDWDRAPKGKAIKTSVDFVTSAGNQQIVVPVFNPATPRPDMVTGFVESHGYVCMEALFAAAPAGSD